MANGKTTGLAGTIIRTLFSPNYILIWLFILMIAFFSIMSEPFMTGENILEILRTCGLLSLMVLGVTWVVAMGEIDIAFPQNAAMSSMVAAYLLARGYSWTVAIIAAIVSGLPLGLLSGFLVAKFRFPSIIASIAVGTVAGSIANIINGGNPLYIATIPPGVNTFVYGTIGGVLGFEAMVAGIPVLETIAGIPILFVVIVCVYAFTTWIQDHTTTGQHLYALGENRKAALEAGIREERVIMNFFTLSALLATASGVILAASFTSGQARLGETFFINGLTAVFLGAMVVKIGKPNVIGTLLGAIIIAALTNGLTMLNVPYFAGLILKGVMMVCGVTTIIIATRVKRKTG